MRNGSLNYRLKDQSIQDRVGHSIKWSIKVKDTSINHKALLKNAQIRSNNHNTIALYNKYHSIWLVYEFPPGLTMWRAERVVGRVEGNDRYT